MLDVPKSADAHRRNAVGDTCAVGSRAVLCITHLRGLVSERDMSVRRVAITRDDVVEQRVTIDFKSRLMADHSTTEDGENGVGEFQNFFEGCRVEDNRQAVV